MIRGIVVAILGVTGLCVSRQEEIGKTDCWRIFKRQDKHTPPDVKIDASAAIEIVKKALKDEEKIFITKMELVEQKNTHGKSWVWSVELRTFHHGHWGPGTVVIDAQTGKADVARTHLHK